MNIYGVVSEFNPFHNGHEHLISEIKKIKNEKIIIAVLSSSFVQRGEPAILSKWDRANLALEAGVNLVVELPFLFSCQNAEVFSKGAIGILNNLKITDLVFGTEEDNIDKLLNISKSLLNNSERINSLLKIKLNEGKSYIVSKNEALVELNILSKEEVGIISKPNNILAVEYINAVLSLNPKINIKNINRIGAQHDSLEPKGNIASATFIRKLIEHDLNYEKYLPEYSLNSLNNINLPNTQMLLKLLQYKFISDKDKIKNCLEYEDGLENRINKFLYEKLEFNDFIEKVSSKRITKSRIRRLIISYLLDVYKEDVFKALNNNEYIRILGMDKTGMSYLKNFNNEYINKFKNIEKSKEWTKAIGSVEIKATNLYSLLNSEPNNLDYTTSPVIKK